MKPWVLLIFLLLALTSAARAEGPVQIKLSHVSMADSTKGLGCQKLKELIENYSNKQIQVEIFSQHAVFKDKEEIDALKLGAIQMIVPSLTKLTHLGSEEFSVFETPYLFPDLQAVHKVLDGIIGQKLLRNLEVKGVKGLGFWDLGFNHFHASKLFKKPADFKGAKIRILKSKILDAQIRALDAIPKVIPRTEVREAFMRNEIQGSESPLSSLMIETLPPKQSYLTLTAHSFHGYILLMNLEFWNRLSKENQAIIERSIKETTLFERDLAEKQEKKALEFFQSRKDIVVYSPTEENNQAFRTALLPIRAKLKKDPSLKLLSEIEEELQNTH